MCLRWIRLIYLSALGASAVNMAMAQSFYESGASSRSAALGGAYSPGESAMDAMAVNPAGLSLIGAPVVELGVTALFARGQFANAVNADGSLEHPAGAVPSGAFGSQLGSSRLSIGVAVAPELMNAAKWRYADPPGGAGGVSYGILDHESAILALRSAFGMGVYLGHGISAGATFGAVYNSNTLRTAYVFQNNPLQGLKTLLDLNTSGVGWNGSVGILASPVKRVRIGMAYKSRATIRSTGTASGNASNQFAKLGIPFRPDFRYDAEVDNVLPQSLTADLIWDVDRRFRIVAQTDWIDWRRAFVNLPVKLTQGNNADINGLLGSNTLADSIPLRWRDQLIWRAGVERTAGENGVFRAGYSHGNNPVPSSTLTPLTAAIMGNSLSAGFGYRHGKYRIDGAYSLTLTAQGIVGQSALKSGEYDNSRVRVGMQSVSLTTSIRF